MEAMFHLHLWDQSHVTLVWNTRETGDMYGQSSVKSDVLVILYASILSLIGWKNLDKDWIEAKLRYAFSI